MRRGAPPSSPRAARPRSQRRCRPRRGTRPQLRSCAACCAPQPHRHRRPPPLLLLARPPPPPPPVAGRRAAQRFVDTEVQRGAACPICMDAFAAGAVVALLPCEHLACHGELLTWAATRGRAAPLAPSAARPSPSRRWAASSRRPWSAPSARAPAAMSERVGPWNRASHMPLDSELHIAARGCAYTGPGGHWQSPGLLLPAVCQRLTGRLHARQAIGGTCFTAGARRERRACKRVDRSRRQCAPNDAACWTAC